MFWSVSIGHPVRKTLNSNSKESWRFNILRAFTTSLIVNYSGLDEFGYFNQINLRCLTFSNIVNIIVRYKINRTCHIIHHRSALFGQQFFKEKLVRFSWTYFPITFLPHIYHIATIIFLQKIQKNAIQTRQVYRFG